MLTTEAFVTTDKLWNDAGKARGLSVSGIKICTTNQTVSSTDEQFG
jgi:hypothetical protein